MPTYPIYIPLHLMSWLVQKPIYRSLEVEARDADPTTSTITLYA